MTDLTRYEQYLTQERSKLSGKVRGAELLSISRFDLGKESFHDSRFVSLETVSESPEKPDEDLDQKTCLRLLGPYFDRHFDLCYERVTSLNFRQPGRRDDLLVHEIRNEGVCVVHEIHFDGGGFLEVACEQIDFRDTPVS